MFTDPEPALLCATHRRQRHCWRGTHLAIVTVRCALVCVALCALLAAAYQLATVPATVPVWGAGAGLAALTAERALVLCWPPVLARRVGVAVAARECPDCYRRRCGYV